MGFMKRLSRKCDFCGTPESVRTVETSDGHPRNVCERCWNGSRVIPYLYPITYLMVRAMLK